MILTHLMENHTLDLGIISPSVKKTLKQYSLCIFVFICLFFVFFGGMGGCCRQCPLGKQTLR